MPDKAHLGRTNAHAVSSAIVTSIALYRPDVLADAIETVAQ